MRAAFRAVFGADTDRFVMIDANRDEDEVEGLVWQAVRDLL